jgi:hypothetical protein
MISVRRIQNSNHIILITMRYWWVNHSQTFDHEVGKGYIWCPKRKKNGFQNHFYETLREVQGDLVFSYADSHLQAVGVAKCRVTPVRVRTSSGRWAKPRTCSGGVWTWVSKSSCDR